MKLGLFICALAGSCFAQTATLTPTCTPATVKPGGTLTCTVALGGGNTTTTGPSDIQLVLTASQSLFVPTVFPAAAATAAQKAVTAGTSAIAGSNPWMVIVSGMNANQIADGPLVTFTIPIPSTVTCAGNSPCLIISVTGTLGSNTAGGVFAITPGPSFPVSVSSACDLNGDGVVDGKDVVVEVNAILTGTAADRNSDGKTNVQDLRLIENAALGGACTVTQ